MPVDCHLPDVISTSAAFGLHQCVRLSLAQRNQTHSYNSLTVGVDKVRRDPAVTRHASALVQVHVHLVYCVDPRTHTAPRCCKQGLPLPL
jgi:hypothetical protein